MGTNIDKMALLDRIKKFLDFWYYQYILHTALYMLDSWERTVFNTLLVAFVAMASYSLYIFLPGHLMMLKHFIAHFWPPETGVDLHDAALDNSNMGTT